MPCCFHSGHRLPWGSVGWALMAPLCCNRGRVECNELLWSVGGIPSSACSWIGGMAKATEFNWRLLRSVQVFSGAGSQEFGG